MKSKTKPSKHDQLYRLAERQGGYFTALQAQASGFSRPLLSHHVKTGHFVRVKHGIYRLTHFPDSPHADLFVAALQANGHGVFSHETALALYDLSDTLPSQIHLTIPPKTSRRHPGLKLHTSRLTRSEITRRSGLAITTVARTLADVIVGGIPNEQARLAVRQALVRGLVSEAALVRYAKGRGGRAGRLITEIVDEKSKR